jgi:hypothetical protein
MIARLHDSFTTMKSSSPESNSEAAFYRKKFLLSIIIPFIVVLFMWLVKITESVFGADFSSLGIYPMEIKVFRE